MPSLSSRLRSLDPWTAGAIGLWTLVMIATPIVRWVFGEAALTVMVAAGVLAQAAAVATVLVRATGWRSLPRIVLPVLLLAWLAEYAGSHTGFPFGRYSYTEALQPQLGGVPLLVPLAWLMMLPPAWALADLITRGSPPARPAAVRLRRAFVAALAFTAWDLFLDPQMAAWGFWVWETPGVYFGIPLTNYLGWLLVSFLVAWLLAPAGLPLRPLLVIYAITWFLQWFGQAFFWGLPGPALCGFLGMGAVLLWAHMRNRT